MKELIQFLATVPVTEELSIAHGLQSLVLKAQELKDLVQFFGSEKKYARMNGVPLRRSPSHFASVYRYIPLYTPVYKLNFASVEDGRYRWSQFYIDGQVGWIAESLLLSERDFGDISGKDSG